MFNEGRENQMFVPCLLLNILAVTLASLDDKELQITLAWTPVWHLSFADRLMPSHETLNYVKRHNPSEMTSIVLKKSETIPWTKFPNETVLLSFECKRGYDEPRPMSEIKRGYIGIFSNMVQYLQISDCIIQQLTAETFKGLTRLATIEIGSKYLLHLTQDVFKPLKSLIWINFSYCSIKSISSDLFCENPKLSFVSFKNNNIRDITGVNERNNTCRAGTLNSLSLEGNNIEDLSNVNFESFKLNGILTLANSSIRTISKKSFEGLSDVITIDLKNNYIRHIPEYAFTSVNTTLRYLNFGNNRLQSIDVSKTFCGLKLETLHLSDNAIASITGRFTELKYIKFLYLQNNLLKKLNCEPFGNLSSLHEIGLSSNKIENIEAGIFDTAANLRRIHISKNNIRYLPTGFFHESCRLTHLYIDSNILESLDETLFSNCKDLEKIDLQNNRLSNISRLLFTSRKLKYINIEYNKFSSMPLFSRPRNGTGCSSISSLQEIIANHNDISYFDTGCYKEIVNLHLSFNLISDISNFDILQNTKQLFLRSNEIKILPRRAMNGLCSSLIVLDVGNNLIDRIEEGAFSNCQNLETLRLDKNRLKMFEPLYLKSFRHIQLSGNPFRCDCENMNLFIWLNTSSTVQIDDATCTNGAFFSTFRFENCTTSVYLSNLTQIVRKIAISVSAVFILIGTLVITLFKFRYEIQVIAFYRWNVRFGYCCMEKEEENVERKYDAFVCFAEEDISFVKKKLLPMIEPKYNVCIYYRDFPVGEDIADSILETIDRSAVIIILLSENFMKSRWGTFEFKSAHYSAIRKKDKRLLIVILNESFLHMKLDLTLRSILYTKSYLKAEDSLFKEKLLHSMPSIPMQSSKQNEYQDNSKCQKFGYENENTVDEIYDTIQL